MAFYLSIVERPGVAASVGSISLLDFTNGISLGQWNQAANGEGFIRELFTVDLKDTNHDAIAADLIALENYWRKARIAHRSSHWIWLEAQMSDETGRRKALVYDGGYAEPLPFYQPPASPGNLVQDVKFTIDRSPWWETSSYQSVDINSISGCGGVSSTISTYGSLPGRLGTCSFVGASSVALTDVWGGFITDEQITLASFTSPWELESGTPGTDTATGSDATASGSSKMATTFTTTTTRATRVSLTTEQISAASYTHLRGIYNGLLRAKCASGVTALVWLGSGMGSSIAWNSPVTVTGTSWKFYPAGQITIPAGGQNGFDGPIRNTTIFVAAELLSGSAGANALDIDCVVPIPAEYYFHLGGGTGYTMYMYVNPFGVVSAYAVNVSSVITTLLDITGTEARTATIPCGNSRLVFAAQRSAGSTLADAANVDFTVYNHYTSLRGAT